MTSKAKQTVFKKAPLALALMGAIQAQAVEFNFGDVNAQWDNTISYGIGWRLEDQDEYQIMPGNGGKGSSYNYDDGTLNYDKGDIYTHVVKWSSDLEISYENYGAFFRARAYYDAAIMDEETDFKPLIDETKDAAGKGAELQDAYVWADYYVGEAPVSLRLGRQVVSWGESTFIQGGINSINPVDASAFRKPGAEVKEGLLPVNMVYTSIGLTTNVSLEAFYQLEWEKTRSDPCGTFFSTVDFVADGCGPVVLGGEADERDILAFRQAEIDTNVPMTQRVAPITERLDDDEPKDSGQFGMAVRWYSEELGDTEFGFYYMNIHSRLPYINGAVSNKDATGTVTGTVDATVNPNATYDSHYPLYQIAYPEDIQIAGVSFATSTESGASISGEISYKPDAPIQWNAFELILAGNAAPYSRLYQARLDDLGADRERELYGEISEGFDEYDIWQIQSTFIKFYDRVMGADRLALVAEAGLTYVDGLPDTDEARYGRSGAYGIGNNDGVWASPADPNKEVNYCTAPGSGQNTQSKHCSDDGYTTELSAGIRARVSATYNNLFSGVNVTPNFSVAYDTGNAPEPGGQFVDDRLTTGLGVNFVYLNQTSFDVSYTNFSGGDYNQIKDRDNITFSAKYSF